MNPDRPQRQSYWVPRRARALAALGFPDVVISTLAHMRFGRPSVRRLIRLQRRRIREEQRRTRSSRAQAIENIKRRLTEDYQELADNAGVDIYGIAIDNTLADMGYHIV